MTPLGELIATPARGLVYGNRGCLHDARGEIRRRWATRRWIACRLEFRGWHREPLLQPGKFTELFFLDEATAFAAGHRPCALCRREDYVRFGELFPGPSGADAMDEQLHAERVDGRERRVCTRRGSRTSRTARSCSRRASRGSCSAASCCAGRRRATRSDARAARHGEADHAAVTRRGPPRRLGRRRAAPPPHSRASPAVDLSPVRDARDEHEALCRRRPRTRSR